MVMAQSYPYSFSSTQQIPEQYIKKIIKIIEEPYKKQQAILGGRGSIKETTFPDIGPVIIKTYLRGGFAKHFSKQTYIKTRMPRCTSEFEYLLKVRDLGINAPEPVACITKGKYLYQAWLVTKKIQHDFSLAELSLKDETLAILHLKEVKRQLAILIENNIHHVDLHPGNILIGKENKVFFIDFDKVRRTFDKNKLQKKYMERWCRAIKKHHLPDGLSYNFKILF